MITHPAFPAEPWSVRETTLDLDLLGQTESVFALANGHIGLRANLDEGAPFAIPGTYVSSFYELRPLPYAEAGYGYPESGQTIVNVTNGKIIRLRTRSAGAPRRSTSGERGSSEPELLGSLARWDETLGIHPQAEGFTPEGVAVIAGPDQPFGADCSLLCPGAGLERVEEREAHGLLELEVAVDLDVGARPELVEIASLLGA
jgi:Glycosyl hydrolase family 65, N-terminal domain